jgi:hypothetical protein
MRHNLLLCLFQISYFKKNWHIFRKREAKMMKSLKICIFYAYIKFICPYICIHICIYILYVYIHKLYVFANHQFFKNSCYILYSYINKNFQYAQIIFKGIFQLIFLTYYMKICNMKSTLLKVWMSGSALLTVYTLLSVRSLDLHNWNNTHWKMFPLCTLSLAPEKKF